MNQEFIDIKDRWLGGISETRDCGNANYSGCYIIALAIFLGLWLIAKAIVYHAHNKD